MIRNQAAQIWAEKFQLVQLVAQHVQALQTMNSEAVGLQADLLHELMALPSYHFECDCSYKNSLLTLLADLLDRSLAALRTHLDSTTTSKQTEKEEVLEHYLGWVYQVSPPPGTPPPKMALLPDYRSKILLLAMLVEPSAVSLMIDGEMTPRVQEIMGEEKEVVAEEKEVVAEEKEVVAEKKEVVGEGKEVVAEEKD